MEAIKLNAGNFDEVVLKSEKTVMVDFWATWCGPCSVMSPLVDEVAKEQKDRLVVGKLNCDESMDIAQRYGITGIPAFLIFKDGEVVDKVMGAMPKGDVFLFFFKQFFYTYELHTQDKQFRGLCHLFW